MLLSCTGSTTKGKYVKQMEALFILTQYFYIFLTEVTIQIILLLKRTRVNNVLVLLFIFIFLLHNCITKALNVFFDIQMKTLNFHSFMLPREKLNIKDSDSQ